jgi:hypothetical protein
MKGFWCYKSKHEIGKNSSQEICKIYKGEFLMTKIPEVP